MHVEVRQIYRMDHLIKAFRICVTCKNWSIGQENWFFAKEKHLRIAYFGGHQSGLPDFGRSWTPNDWHKVNFRPTPENFRTDSISWNLVVYKHLGTNRFFVTSRADCCEAFECFKRSWRRVWFGFGTPVGLSFKNRLALNMMPDMPILGDISESCVYLFWKPLGVICFDLFAGHETISFF